MKFVSLLIFFILNFLFIQAQCPWNRVNCSHGCGRHFDENKDGYCDYSILELNKVNSIDTVLKNEITKSKKKDSIIIAKNKNITKPSPTKIAPESTFVSEIDTINNKISETKLTPNLNPKSTVNTPPYDLILISCITLFLYGISFMMVKFKQMRKNIHRRIWNILLLITFLISCLFGFFLVVQINYQFAFDWLSTLLYWHVQIGISMTIISVIHILWHITYFKKIFSKQ